MLPLGRPMTSAATPLFQQMPSATLHPCRKAGSTAGSLSLIHIYPLSKMLALAFDGITSLSNKPIRIITGAGIVVSLIGFIGVIWAIVQAILGSSVAGWASIVCIVCFMGGVQLVCLGVIGEYIGKIYMETKARPRYIISERTWAPYERKYHG